MPFFFILFIGLMLLSWYVSSQLQSKFEQYSKISLRNGMSGAEIAKKMLADQGIFDVSITSTEGTLTDHYNPATKTVNLSHDVCYGRNVAAAAVAAHECGHAVQHAKSYSFLQVRSSLVPFVSATSRYMQWILLAGILTISIFPAILGVGVFLFALTTLFSFITLPVEYDASNRALAWLEKSTIVNSSEHEMAADALNWAARTYVVAAISSLATLIHYLMIFLRNRR